MARLLVVRNDKLGDFTLSLPTFALLRERLPDHEIVALVTDYTRPLAELVPAIDRVLIDPGPHSPGGRPAALARRLRAECFDLSLSLLTTARTGAALFLARIPRRYAPATKLAQALHNRRVRQRRSRSDRPEWRYNVELGLALLDDLGRGGDWSPTRPVLARPSAVVAARRAELRARHGLPSGSALVALHAGHGGSANNLTPEQYAELANGLRSSAGHAFLCTAGPGEEPAARRLAEAITAAPAAVEASRAGLADFVDTLAATDLVIGGSTGPLHLAGALDRPTAMFYPRRRTSSPLRWQCLSSEDRRLAFTPPEPFDERDLSAIDLQAASDAISRLLGA